MEDENNTENTPLPVTLQRSQLVPTKDVFLWATILKSTKDLSFESFSRKMDSVLCNIGDNQDKDSENIRDKAAELLTTRSLPFRGIDTYHLLKVATEAIFLSSVQTLSSVSFAGTDNKEYFDEVVKRLGPVLSQDELNSLDYFEKLNVEGSEQKISTLPYLALVRRKLKDQGIINMVSTGTYKEEGYNILDRCQGILADRLSRPLFVELIWSYWHEEGMQVQSMKALSRRFQNVRTPGGRDPLSNLDIDPLRPLSSLLWGYVQDEQHRLTVRRRAYEYDHHYGISLHGNAVGNLQTADSRSKFLEGFHNLLYLATLFYRQDDDTTVIADSFSLLNALRDVHMVMAQGAHNQFGDLPSTSRQEMLLEQWLLARPELREFLPTRIMVAYPEEWMDRVDAMKSLQGWTNTSIIHFNDLAMNGERILLSIRYNDWSATNDPLRAANWARFWRPEIQRYTYAYRTVTGVDLTAEIVDSQRITDRYLAPSVHLRRQLELQQGKAPPAVYSAAGLPSSTTHSAGRASLPSPAAQPVASLPSPARSRVKR